MKQESIEQGKSIELLVLKKLVDEKCIPFLPFFDKGIDAVICNKNGKLIGIQIKSTRAEDMAGYFNAYLHSGVHFVVCVDLSPLDKTPSQSPEVWIFPSEVFKNPEYSTRQTTGEYRLPLAAKSQKHGNKPRKELLKEYREAWYLLTGDKKQL